MPSGSQERVGHSMDGDVAVGVAVEARGAAKLQAAQRERLARPEGVPVLAQPDAGSRIAKQDRLGPSEVGEGTFVHGAV